MSGSSPKSLYQCPPAYEDGNSETIILAQDYESAAKINDKASRRRSQSAFNSTVSTVAAVPVPRLRVRFC